MNAPAIRASTVIVKMRSRTTSAIATLDTLAVDATWKLTIAAPILANMGDHVGGSSVAIHAVASRGTAEKIATST